MLVLVLWVAPKRQLECRERGREVGAGPAMKMLEYLAHSSWDH